MFKLRLVNQNITVPAEGGTLAEALERAGYPPDLVCNGRGTCGQCRVDVVRNGQRESVLACRTPVDSDMDVYASPHRFPQTGKVLTEGFVSPVVALKPTHRADGAHYGAAVDIGSTTVVLYAYDLHSGACIATRSMTNPQTAHGGDVVSRIRYALEVPGGLETLRRLIVGGICELLDQVEQECPGFEENLRHAVLCGNSAMQHFFFCYTPDDLATAPFACAHTQAITCDGKTAGLPMAPHGQVDFLPLLGGFVGADTASVLLLPAEDSDRELIIDLGTNGEIALSRQGRFTVASTACGPVLEGADIRCGMRGIPGAIDHVTVTPEGVRFSVIGGIDPVGLCGSAVIDTVAELVRRGIVDETGHLLSRAEYEETHPGSPLLSRLMPVSDHQNGFVLRPGIVFSQQDVRQVQLAKSAVCAGCMTLLGQVGWTAENVSRLYLSGAFGSYMDIDNALFIGLLPPVARDRIVSLGNGAGQGVQMCLRNREILRKAKELPRRCRHKVLANDPVFSDAFIENMAFPKV